MKWQPIETAPERGVYLLYQPPHCTGRMTLAERVILRGDGGFVRRATHWCPIPPLPTQGDE